MKVEIFCDSANIEDIKAAYKDKTISGITTNPSLIAKSGCANYLEFCKEAVISSKDKPISFEVLSDDPVLIEKEAILLSDISNFVYVKIPIVNSKGESLLPVIKKLSQQGMKINVTAVFSFEQIDGAMKSLSDSVESYISIFAGRIADTGLDPKKFIRYCAERKAKNHKIIWASPREIHNIVQAEESGAEIITLFPQLIEKLSLIGKDLEEFSIETSKMFFDDAKSSGLSIEI